MRYYEGQGRQKQSALDALRQQYGSAIAANSSRLTEAQRTRDQQDRQAREARAFKREQNRLQREAASAQSQQQYNLAMAQLRENKRQFGLTHGGPAVDEMTGQDKNISSWMSDYQIPAWVKKFGNRPEYKNNKAALYQAFQDMGAKGISRGTNADGSQALMTVSPRVFNNALNRYLGSRKRR
jgi:hypothetical protein